MLAATRFATYFFSFKEFFFSTPFFQGVATIPETSGRRFKARSKHHINALYK